MRPGRGLEHPTLDTIAAAYSAVVIERQLQLERLFEAGDWSLDLERGVLDVRGRALDVVLLARTDSVAGTWQWAWQTPYNQTVRASPHRIAPLIEIGQRYDVPELATGTLRLSGVHDGGQGPGHTLAITGCGVLASRGYFPATYDGGAAWLLITDSRLRTRAPDAQHAVRLLDAAVARFPHDNRLTVETYLGVHGIQARDEGDQLTAAFADGDVRFTFDSTGRLRRTD